MQLYAGPPSSKGGHGGAYSFQAARLLQDTMCIRPADLIKDYDIRRGDVGRCNPVAGDYSEVSFSGNIICSELG
jgi:hypothetical protein